MHSNTVIQWDSRHGEVCCDSRRPCSSLMICRLRVCPSPRLLAGSFQAASLSKSQEEGTTDGNGRLYTDWVLQILHATHDASQASPTHQSIAKSTNPAEADRGAPTHSMRGIGSKTFLLQFLGRGPITLANRACSPSAGSSLTNRLPPGRHCRRRDRICIPSKPRASV